MTVAELKEKLDKFDDEAEVFVDDGAVNYIYVDEVVEVDESTIVLR